MRVGSITLIVVALAACCAHAELDDEAPTVEQMSAREAVREGNRMLLGGDAPSALEAYGRAENLRPEALEIPFVQGLGHFALQEYDKAREAFKKAATSPDQSLADDAIYSAGTCDHMQALAGLDAPEEAIEKLENAMQQYENVLANRPEHEAARDAVRKAAMMRRQLKELLQQQQQQQQDKQQSDDQDKEDKSEGDQEQQQDQQQDQEQEQQESSSEEDEQQEQAQQRDAEAEQEERVSREQAERRLREMMQALRERKEHRRRQVQKIPVAPVDKDW